MKSSANQKIRRNHFEFLVTDHCFLKCNQCANFSPYNKPNLQQVDAFSQHLKLLNEVMHVNQIRFLGGEPLLNQILPDFIRVVKDLKFADCIAVLTNGLLLKNVDDDLFALIDRLDISLYPDNNYRRFNMNRDSIMNIAKKKQDKYKFELKIINWEKWQHAYVDFPIKEHSLVKKIYNACGRAHYLAGDGAHTIYDGYYYKCAVPIYLRNYLEKKVGNHRNIPDYRTLDGVHLNSNNLSDLLKRYIKSKSPLKACSYCLGTSGKHIPIEQRPIDDLENPQPELISNIKTVLSLNRLLYLGIFVPIHKKAFSMWMRLHKYSSPNWF
jgi:organic radical activating enzyme